MNTPKQGARRFRFSLRTLLVFVLLLSVSLGWFAHTFEKTIRQRKAVRAIVEAGGTVAYLRRADAPWADEPEWRIVGEGKPIPAWLQGCVIQVGVHGSGFRDNDMARLVAHLVNLPNLKALSVSRTKITDHGVQCLAVLTNLKYLVLYGTNVTDEGVEKLEEALPDCEIVR